MYERREKKGEARDETLGEYSHLISRILRDTRWTIVIRITDRLLGAPPWTC